MWTFCVSESYPTIHFRLHLRRKPLYFIMNIVLPSIMLSMLVLLVFLLPAESGEKPSLGVTILLAFAVFILMIAESVPRTSDAVPIIGRPKIFKFARMRPKIFFFISDELVGKRTKVTF